MLWDEEADFVAAKRLLRVCGGAIRESAENNAPMFSGIERIR